MADELTPEQKIAADNADIAHEQAIEHEVEPGATTSEGTKPVSQEEAEAEAHEQGATEPGQPPADEVKAMSEGRHVDEEGQYSSQEDLTAALDPAVPTLKADFDAPLPIFHPQVATATDDHADHERPAIDASEIN